MSSNIGSDAKVNIIGLEERINVQKLNFLMYDNIYIYVCVHV